MRSTVGERGQITIPKRLRDRLGIRPGQVLEVEEVSGRLVVAKVEETDPFTRNIGVWGMGGDTDALLVELRGEADPI